MNKIVERSAISAAPVGIQQAPVAALLILTLGHVLSNALRSVPAISFDLIATDFEITTETQAAIASIYYILFALLQIPIGIVLDRYSVKVVALSLLIGTMIGSVLAALSDGVVSYTISQAIIGASTSGMLMCPMMLAAKRLTTAQFGLWAGVILSLGNTGMLLSSTPLALMVDQWGWRSGYWAATVAAVGIAATVLIVVPRDAPQECNRRSTIVEIVDILRMSVGRNLRGIIILSFVSLAAQIVLRGLWVGPWLMDVKGISRIEAGNILMLFTLTIVLAPMLSGLIDNKLNNPRYLLLAVHLVAALLLLIMALGAPNYPLSRLFGLQSIPTWIDSMLLVSIGLLVSMQSLLFAFARQVVATQNIGKALAATNLSCMIGTAVMQFITSPVALVWGLPATFILMASSLAVGAISFFFLTRSAA